MKLRLLIAGILGATLIAGMCYGARYLARSYFTSALASNTYAEVVYKDRTFVVRDGNIDPVATDADEHDALPILILAYKKLLAERAPFFSLSGENLDELSTSLDLLEEQQRIFADGQSTAISSAHISTSLYPIQFLRTAARLEAARRQFIAESSEENATVYEELLRDTLRAYKEDLSRHRHAYNELIPTDIPAYGMLGSIIRKSDMEKIFTTLEEQNKSSARLVMRRTLCTHTLTFFCNPQDLDLPRVPTPPAKKHADSTLSSTIVGMYRELKTDLDPSIIVRLAASTCVRPDMQVDYTFMRLPRYKDAYALPVYVGDLVYIRSADHTDSPFYAYFNDNGIERVLVVPATYYECSEALHDFAATLSVRAIKDFAAEQGVSEILSDVDSAEEIAEMRRSLMERVVREEDAIAYLNSMIQSLAQDSSTAKIRRVLNDIALAYSGRTRGLTEIVFAMTNEERGNRYLAERGAEFDTTALNLFYTRSGFGSLFTVGTIRPGESADSIFPRNDLRRSRQPYEYFSSSPETALFREDFMSDLRHFIDSHEAPRHE